MWGSRGRSTVRIRRTAFRCGVRPTARARNRLRRKPQADGASSRARPQPQAAGPGDGPLDNRHRRRPAGLSCGGCGGGGDGGGRDRRGRGEPAAGRRLSAALWSRVDLGRRQRLMRTQARALRDARVRWRWSAPLAQQGDGMCVRWRHLQRQNALGDARRSDEGLAAVEPNHPPVVGRVVPHAVHQPCTGGRGGSGSPRQCCVKHGNTWHENTWHTHGLHGVPDGRIAVVRLPQSAWSDHSSIGTTSGVLTDRSGGGGTSAILLAASKVLF